MLHLVRRRVGLTLSGLLQSLRVPRPNLASTMFHSRDMVDALDMSEAEVAGIGELALHDLGIARGFAARAQAAEVAQGPSDPRMARVDPAAHGAAEARLRGEGQAAEAS